jgi:TonB-linked SusC/RagA family outer membrane protein
MRKFAYLFALILLSLHTMAQDKTVSGKVINQENNQPVAGATVSLKGSDAATQTDTDGSFTIAVPNSNAVLIFSYVGLASQEIPVRNQNSLSVTLQSASANLNEIVVTGYSTERKKDITGAVSVVKMKDVASIPSGNIMSTLQGRVPGLNVFNDGTPGGVGTGVSVRGITTINNNTPLYVIDGVQTRANIATLLNSNDVESIQVLKDAASASIYGTQASNGVIIITTKKAGRNQLKVDFDMQLTAQTFRSGIKLLNAQQWGEVYWKAYQNDGIQPRHDLYGSGPTPVIPEFINQKKTIRAGNTNWAEEVYKTSLLKNYNVSVLRGGENGSSTFSLNYFDQDGLIMHTNFSRFNARFNSDYSFLKNRLRIGENMNVSRWNEKLKPAGIEELTIAQHPLIPVYDINGGYAGPTQGVGDKPNPVRLLNQQRDNRSEQWRIFGNAYMEVEPIKNLVLRSNIGLNYRNGFFAAFSPKWSEGDRTVDKNSLYTKSDNDREWIWSNTIRYKTNFRKHAINVFAGTEAKEFRTEFLDATREDYLIEALDYRYLTSGSGKQTNGGLASRTAITSHFGQANYAFNDRYLLSGSIRRDASSRFGRNNNAGVFPGVSAGWVISEEDFLKETDLLSFLKVRASWGQNGNDLLDNEATYTKYLTSLILGGYDIAGINQGVIPVGIVKERTGNPNIKWEVTTQTNFGVDVTLLNSRLAVTLDYYIKDTKDMLIDRPYIAIIGEGGYMAYNGASMSNKGVEGIITWRDRINNKVSYDVSFTASAYKNRITSLPKDIYYTWGGGNGRDKSIVGQPFGSWMGYRTNGLYRTQDEVNNSVAQNGKGPGRIRYQDISGDKMINDNDRTWLGSDQPKFIGGLNVGLTYKSFDFAFFLNGMVRDAWNNSKFYTDFFQLWTGNHSTRLLDAWNSTTNFNSPIPALTAVNNNDEGRGSDYFIENGSYMKLKNLQLGYTLPTAFSGKLRMRNFRVYLQAQDLFTITKYTGADPEALGYPYPIPRTFTFGANVGF